MNRLFLIGLSLCLLTVFSCNSAKKNNQSKSENMNSAYYQLTKTDQLSDFEGKKVQIDIYPSKGRLQHMMKSAAFEGEQEEHQYVVPANDFSIGEFLVYYTKKNIHWPVKASKIRIFGTVGSVSGAGKGGGTHTEYYMDLEKLEGLE